MLLEFSAENYRSLRDQQSLDLRATATRDLSEVIRHPPGLDAGSRGVVATAAVFGANASGKSSLFMAADFMRSAVLHSAAEAVEGAGALQRVTPFRFDREHRRGPVTLRVAFLKDAIRHEYGMVLAPSQGAREFTRVTSEWLRMWPKNRVRDVFLRGEAAAQAGHPQPWWVSEDGFHGGHRLAADLFEQTRDDVLFLSLASQRNHPQAKAVVSWFNEQFVTTALQSSGATEAAMLADPHFAGYVNRLLGAADTGIQRIEVVDNEDGYRSLRGTLISIRAYTDILGKSYTTRTIHRDEAGEDIALALDDESHGTQRLFRLAGPIYDALRHGRCLWIDELDTGMHHWLLRALIKMFQSPDTNPHGAQLLFTTHDAALMDPTLFRRDQIWLVEKDAAQGTQLYSLVDFEDKPRKQQPLFKSFLSGRFGGVPNLDEAAIMAWPRGDA
jgi:hypothetical protein